jgi:PAS domain S-box-containing protein
MSFNAILITTAEPGYPIVYANPRFSEMTGYSLHELIGRSPKILQGEKTNPRILQNLKLNIAAGKPFHGAAINYRKNGEQYPVQWTIFSITDEHNDITHYVSVQKDLSRLKSIVSSFKQTNEHFREFILDISRADNRDPNVAIKQAQFSSEVLDNTRFYNPELRSDENIDLFDDELFDFSDDMNGILATRVQYDTVSAKEYNTKYNVKLDIQEINHRIGETQEKFELLNYSKNVTQELLEISQNLHDIANSIFYLEEFVEISSALNELANQTRGYAKNEINPMVTETYRGLMTDLESWVSVMFIHQSADNVHELDASIISSAKQLMQFLN